MTALLQKLFGTPQQHGPHMCPSCGATTGIYSYYRDGGSTLNHPSCRIDPLHTWPNPDFKPLGGER